MKIRTRPLSKHTDKCVRGATELRTHQRCVSPAVFTSLHQSGPLIPPPPRTPTYLSSPESHPFQKWGFSPLTQTDEDKHDNKARLDPKTSNYNQLIPSILTIDEKGWLNI